MKRALLCTLETAHESMVSAERLQNRLDGGVVAAISSNDGDPRKIL